LKSLTVLDLNGGRITGVAYGSSAPVEKQLGDLNLPIADKNTLSDFLGGLRGARLEVRNGATTIAGRLLSVERKTRINGGTTLEIDYLSLLSDSGELRTTEISPGFSLRLLDKGLTGRVDRLLDIVASGRSPDVRNMVISTDGAGERRLFVSYISEVPVWKSTYRIVLDDKSGKDPLLQGWAIVDNTVGQDWENVQLSLVAGAPQSFVENLSTPYYTRRPVVGLPQGVLANPQTHEATLIGGEGMLFGRITDPTGATIPGVTVEAFDSSGAKVAETRTGADGIYHFATLPEGATRVIAAAPGFSTAIITGVSASASGSKQQDVGMQIGSTAESVTVVAGAPSMVQTESGEVSANVGNAGHGRMLGTGDAIGSGRGLNRAAAGAGHGAGGGSGIGGGSGSGSYISPAATGQELGDLFEYKLKDPITILKNRSALVPIAQSSVKAERVSIWNDRAGLPRPERALWLTNSSGLTLDGGSFSVMEEDTFAGEGIFDPIRPGEKRLLSYALDPALNATSRATSAPQRVTRCAIAKGMLKQTSEIRESRVYTFRNQGNAPRSVIVEHPVRTGYHLLGETKPEETTADLMRFRVQVPPQQTASLTVEEARPVAANYQVSSLSSDQVDLFLRQQSIDKSVEEALRRVLAAKIEAAELDSQKDARDEEMKGIFDDQQRLRENLKALKGSPEEKALVQRYTQQLNQQEDSLAKLRAEIQDLQAKMDSKQAALDRLIQDMAFDIKL
ncbi:MAG: carboxypeptidase regulatory-like domain-containing protein, partial [Bryobacteraceae bacterium]